MATINDAIHQTVMLAIQQAANEEKKRIWTIINLDMMIPMEVKSRIRDLIFGVNSEEPILSNR